MILSLPMASDYLSSGFSHAGGLSGRIMRAGINIAGSAPGVKRPYCARHHKLAYGGGTPSERRAIPDAMATMKRHG